MINAHLPLITSLIFSLSVQGLYLRPLMPRDDSPVHCRTNLTIPSIPEPCFLSCQPIRELQRRCSDTIPCMCHNAPPPYMDQCLQCVLEAAGDVVSMVPNYLNETFADVQAYSRACDALKNQVVPDTNKPEAQAVRNWCPTIALTPAQVSIHSKLRHRPLHEIIPLLSIACALCFYCLHRANRTFRKK
ncbi:kazal domain-containing proteinase inhibitor [Laccaria bicolor S238N-H82]|uniref:Kazal domain-containing proteinase inhibitor n=1 Tax=Laccaria bicolor (strain S238N-H82 / ATCC MYA-4686) TaxID=486041 RepID=B0DXD5_LACBS|nr:kazal domain-containing proteinase inhibitor [Laccaria bicolor S238N-H82]EDR00772.1 kazal domain-containing proteinase inhibitor [Laccaria bicolor S238N-H82]|eukprot:XP_001888564.1 kazal domain-containing proteinase inhibitor [Laccaria bicolor S238N-H82]